MVYEIVNPSDAYTMVADDFKVAAAACLLLGQGAYSIHNADRSEDMPLFLFGGADEWVEKTFGSFDEYLLGHLEEIAACLDSVMSCGFRERVNFDAAMAAIEDPAKREAYRLQVHDTNRSSLNDIGAKAWRMAGRCREKLAETIKGGPSDAV